MLRLFVAVLFASACFSPTLPTGGPCGDGQVCPPGQFCSTERICVNSSTRVDAAADGDGALEPDGSTAGVMPIDNAVAPTEIAGSSGCVIDDPKRRKTVAVDALERIYVAAICADGAAIAVSEDGGESFRDFTSIGVNAQPGDSIAVVATAASEAVVAVSTANGVDVVRTADGGRMWSAPMRVSNRRSVLFGISASHVPGLLLFAVRDGPEFVVLRSTDDGISFSEREVMTLLVHGDVVALDSDDVYLVGDEPDLGIHISGDGGLSFGATQMVPEAPMANSEWAAAGGDLIGVGSSGDGRRVPGANPDAASRVIVGFGPGPTGRTVSGLPTGEILFGLRSDGVVRLYYLSSGGIESRDLEDGRQPAVHLVRPGVALVAFEDAGALKFAVELF